jgi:enoyl-CoA hydratase/carnithine racemase
MRNHQKTDRMLGLALQHKLPVILFAEGGGGRPGDVDMPIVAGLHVATFASFARLNGQVPVLGIAAGRCFAGNAALLGCCDVVIATRGSNIGMGGPAMVEGGGLGVFTPEQIGPSTVQHANGVIDILVDDEAQAVAAAKHYLGFFTGVATTSWQAPDALALRACSGDGEVAVRLPAHALAARQQDHIAHLLPEIRQLFRGDGLVRGLDHAASERSNHPLASKDLQLRRAVGPVFPLPVRLREM